MQFLIIPTWEFIDSDFALLYCHFVLLFKSCPLSLAKDERGNKDCYKRKHCHDCNPSCTSDDLKFRGHADWWAEWWSLLPSADLWSFGQLNQMSLSRQALSVHPTTNDCVNRPSTMILSSDSILGSRYIKNKKAGQNWMDRCLHGLLQTLHQTYSYDVEYRKPDKLWQQPQEFLGKLGKLSGWLIVISQPDCKCHIWVMPQNLARSAKMARWSHWQPIGS